MATKVFISYKRGSSTAFAEQLHAFFESKHEQFGGNNYEPFIDKDTIGGDPWWSNICDQIIGRSHFIPLLNNEYFDSNFCMEELHFAIRCSSILIPIRVDPYLSLTDIERQINTLSDISGDSIARGLQIIDCLDEDVNPTKLEKIFEAVCAAAPRNYHARMSLPRPERPLYPPETLHEIEEQLSNITQAPIESIIRNLRMISNYENYRDEVLGLLTQLIEHYGQYLSYQQYNEVQEIIRRLNTEYPQNIHAILEATSDLGITSIYSSRTSAAEDVFSAINSSDTNQICLLGVSLNNFERVQGEFHPSWEMINRLVEDPSTPRNLDIKILIAHPYSLGAVMRSKSEENDVPPNARRLRTEVERTASQLKILQQKLHSKGNASIKIEARLYLAAPILFLCWTNKTSFIQQYYFWSAHEATSMPLLRFDQNSPNVNGKKIHGDLLHHFLWIWDYASVPLTDYLNEHQYGVEAGLYQAGAVNVYTSNSEAKERILYLLKNANERVWIQGITLHSFFGKDPQLTNAFIDVVSKDIDVRVLLLNPDGEQAKYRAYREYLIVQKQLQEDPVSFIEFVRRKLHQKTKLSLESQLTKYEIDLLQRGTKNSKFQFKMFDSAPYCFMLIVDQHVLVEQYHYGNEDRAADRYRGDLILGKDMPKIEYSPHVPDIFLPYEESNNKELKLSNLLADHFQFAFDTAISLSHDDEKTTDLRIEEP